MTTGDRSGRHPDRDKVDRYGDRKPRPTANRGTKLAPDLYHSVPEGPSGVYDPRRPDFEAVHDLVKRVEAAGYTDRYGIHRNLVPSTPRGSLWALARCIYVRRARFAPGVVLSDLEVAISDPDFDGLHGKAWGLLLSHAFIDRYIAAVNKRAQQQQAREDEARRRLEFGFANLDAADPTERCKAAHYLLQSRQDLAIPVLVELLADPNVRGPAAGVLDEWQADVISRPGDRMTPAAWALVDTVLAAAKAALDDPVNPPTRNSYCWVDLTSLVIGLGVLVKHPGF